MVPALLLPFEHLILGAIVEERLSQAMITFDNDWLRFFEARSW